MEKKHSYNKPFTKAYPDEKEPILLLLTQDLSICAINPSGAVEFFNQTPDMLINTPLFPLLLEYTQNPHDFFKAIEDTSSWFTYLKLEHKTLRTSYSVTITTLSLENVRQYAVTMIDSGSFDALKSYTNAIINSLPGAVYWKDREGRYLGCNTFVAQMAGFNHSEELIGKTDYELCWHELADEWRKLDHRVMKENTTIVQEDKIKLANGTLITELTFKTPLKNEYEEIVGIIGTSLDLTAQKEMEAALLKAQAAHHAKNEFIANMSHDIRTPLTGVIGMSQMLKENARNTENEQYAGWIKESGEQLLNLLNRQRP